MSGAGRKHRAKQLTSQYLNVASWEGLKDEETLAVCLEAPHNQHIRVLVLKQDSPNDQYEERMVMLPRKFHKVIWIAIKNVVVIDGTTIVYKPSPEQLKVFYKEANHAGWQEVVGAAQERAQELRQAPTRQPIHNKGLATTIAAALPDPEDARRRVAEVEEEETDVTESHGLENDPLLALGNQNRNNIKHKQPYFFGVEEEEEEEEEGEEDEEEPN
ncbi:hypothetical protein STCU_02737 [Strigomonas culicis]|uniref:Uncharacterized protein n=1 Tax=Strigomonas culicis TaxID=28005 RepID=S9W9Y9_9TRYP|nr:hypothetical protein STCU_02737 [Strigomonas culicis]|eukprot:EPY32700.1 hypothetical protein STCU_02737 [Strigomonas culicis]